jgi:hypothetical protein
VFPDGCHLVENVNLFLGGMGYDNEIFISQINSEVFLEKEIHSFFLIAKWLSDPYFPIDASILNWYNPS